MVRAVVALGFAVLGFVLGAVGGFMSTPLLWALEKPTGLELAGHSGPADWVLLLFGVLGAAVASGTYVLMSRAPSK